MICFLVHSISCHSFSSLRIKCLRANSKIYTALSGLSPWKENPDPDDPEYHAAAAAGDAHHLLDHLAQKLQLLVLLAVFPHQTVHCVQAWSGHTFHTHLLWILLTTISGAPVILASRHFVILTSSHFVIYTSSHPVTESSSHPVILSYIHLVILSPNHPLIQSSRNFLILWPSLPPFLSPCWIFFPSSSQPVSFPLSSSL